MKTRIPIPLLLVLAFALISHAQLAVGTKRVPITTDGTNVFDPPFITFTNQIRITVAPASSNQVVRWQDGLALTRTNTSLSGATNVDTYIGGRLVTTTNL